MDLTKKLDRIDVKILARLQQCGRISNVELADAVGLSASPCLKRVKRLEKNGYIESYTANLNLSKLLSPTIVFTEITLTKHQARDFHVFEQAIKQVDEVSECHLISGGYDYLLKFICASVAHYQSIIESMLNSQLGIENYFSYIVIKSPIEYRSINLEKLVREN